VYWHDRLGVVVLLVTLLHAVNSPRSCTPKHRPL
jgi:hypothetical protein